MDSEPITTSTQPETVLTKVDEKINFFKQLFRRAFPILIIIITLASTVLGNILPPAYRDTYNTFATSATRLLNQVGLPSFFPTLSSSQEDRAFSPSTQPVTEEAPALETDTQTATSSDNNPQATTSTSVEQK